jgi:Cys-rich protein (TIGR01571 family)
MADFDPVVKPAVLAEVAPQQQQQQYLYPGAAVIIPSHIATQPMTQWQTGICTCLDDAPSCMESWLIPYSQNSRQYNVVMNGKQGLEPWSCLVPFAFDICIGGGFANFLFTWHLRQRLRGRYAIVGDDFSDCAISFFMPMCAISQHYREMSLRGEWPSGLCASRPFTMFLPPPQMSM